MSVALNIKIVGFRLEKFGESERNIIDWLLESKAKYSVSGLMYLGRGYKEYAYLLVASMSK